MERTSCFPPRNPPSLIRLPRPGSSRYAPFASIGTGFGGDSIRVERSGDRRSSSPGGGDTGWGAASESARPTRWARGGARASAMAAVGSPAATRWRGQRSSRCGRGTVAALCRGHRRPDRGLTLRRQRDCHEIASAGIDLTPRAGHPSLPRCRRRLSRGRGAAPGSRSSDRAAAPPARAPVRHRVRAHRGGRGAGLLSGLDRADPDLGDAPVRDDRCRAGRAVALGAPGCGAPGASGRGARGGDRRDDGRAAARPRGWLRRCRRPARGRGDGLTRGLLPLRGVGRAALAALAPGRGELRCRGRILGEPHPRRPRGVAAAPSSGSARRHRLDAARLVAAGVRGGPGHGGAVRPVAGVGPSARRPAGRAVVDARGAALRPRGLAGDGRAVRGARAGGWGTGADRRRDRGMGRGAPARVVVRCRCARPATRRRRAR